MPEVIADTDKRLTFIPRDKASTPPPGLIRHIKDSWWIVHPEKGVVFFKQHSPQCNRNKEITRRIAAMYPWAEVRFIPSVFHKINPDDWAN